MDAENAKIIKELSGYKDLVNFKIRQLLFEKRQREYRLYTKNDERLLRVLLNVSKLLKEHAYGSVQDLAHKKELKAPDLRTQTYSRGR